MTNEEKAAKVEALLSERRGCESRLAQAVKAGDADGQKSWQERVDAVGAELRRLGGEGDVPAKRAERRTSKSA